MSSYRELVDSLESALTGYAVSPSQTHLTEDITAGDLTLPLADHQKVSAGLVQVGDELMWVDSTAESGAVVPPYGRGYQSSTAASWPAGTRVVNKPAFPRHRIGEVVNEVIRNLFPGLYGVETTEVVHQAAVLTYELPANCAGVLSVTYETVGPSQLWPEVRRWRYNPSADASRFPSGKSIDLWQGGLPGYPWRIVYKTTPVSISDGDEFTDSNLPEYCEDVVKNGVLYMLIGRKDFPRLQTRTVESSQRAVYVETGAASDASKYYYALFQSSRDEAQMRLLKEHPPQVHLTRY